MEGADVDANDLMEAIESEHTSPEIRQTARNALKQLYLTGKLSHKMMDEIETRHSYLKL
jgi:hypothetical protein